MRLVRDSQILKSPNLSHLLSSLERMALWGGGIISSRVPNRQWRVYSAGMATTGNANRFYRRQRHLSSARSFVSGRSAVSIREWGWTGSETEKSDETPFRERLACDNGSDAATVNGTSDCCRSAYRSAASEYSLSLPPRTVPTVPIGQST